MKVMKDLAGEVLSHRYRLVARVAGGGMGEVYRGHDLLLDRVVAVKVLQPALAGQPELVGRFRAEARAAARLSHPNIVAVHDWGSQDERTYYMVMEYVSGTDLRDLLVSQGSLDATHAAMIMATVCEALNEAHERGLVHRDIKPENILLARDGTVKVADFGIAAMIDADRSAPGGSIPGTLRYLSPEQAAGREATAASDIWAAGAVLYELLTGTAPLNASGPEVLKRRATEEVEPPSKVAGHVPRDLDSVVEKACALHPAERFRSAGEMAEALHQVAGNSLPEAPPLDHLLDHVTGEIRLPDMEPTTFVSGRTRRKQLRRRRRLLIAAAALLLAVLGFGGAKAASWLFAPEMVPVPDLEGLARGRAVELVLNEGLRFEVVGRDTDVDVPKNHVIEQQPSSGELKEGSTVEVVLSSGPPKFEVPNVVGLEPDKAKVRLRVRKMEIGRRTFEYSMEPEGTIVRQVPDSGLKLPWGSKIDVVISRGPEPVAVPDVVGKTQAKAESILASAGFEAVPIEAYSDDVPKDRVIETDPVSSEVTPRGSEVQIFVSIGPRFDQVTMPDVRNMKVGDAKAELEGLGLRVKVVESCAGGDTVVETHPIAGTKIRENTQVALFVC